MPVTEHPSYSVACTTEAPPFTYVFCHYPLKSSIILLSLAGVVEVLDSENLIIASDMAEVGGMPPLY